MNFKIEKIALVTSMPDYTLKIALDRGFQMTLHSKGLWGVKGP